MGRVRSIALSGDVMTFTDSLDFLDSQDIFDIIFGDDPTMLTLTLRKKGKCATDNTNYLIKKLDEFCNFCPLHIFCDSVQLKYVGTDVYDIQKNTCGYFSCTFETDNGFFPFAIKGFLHPDDLFSRFTATEWNVLVILSSDVVFSGPVYGTAGSCSTRGYIFPDISKLTTSLLQEHSKT